MDDRIGYMLKRVQAALRGQLEQALQPLGVTAPQYAVLAALARQPALANAELARRAFVTPQTMVRMVASLEAGGLLARTTHPSHGRLLPASLTRKGERLVVAGQAGVAEVEARMLAEVGEEERRQLLDLLLRCAVALG
jgi:DNA-binding MarR family transcriptional regulator